MTVIATFFVLLQASLLFYCLWIATFYGCQLIAKVYERNINHSRFFEASKSFVYRTITKGTAKFAGYPKAQHLIEDIRRWILQSDYAQKCYLQVVRTFAQNLIELGMPKEDIKIPEQKDVREFFEKSWPTFLPSPALEKEGVTPSRDNKIYIQNVLLEVYETERDKAKQKQWRHVLLTLALHELAIALTRYLLPANGELLEDYNAYAETGWHLEDLLFGGALEVEWPAERQGRLEQIVRLVVSTPNNVGSRDSYDLSYPREQEGQVPLGIPLNLWAESIDQTVLGDVQGNVFPRFVGDWAPALSENPPAGWIRNRATLSAMQKPPEKASWNRERAASFKQGSKKVGTVGEGRHVMSGSSGEPSWVMADNGGRSE